mmetsp:Transcript_11291/g.31684  ORF Transcript_11291/g.31684 Transcript_11291/m.31684 type:complete len:103 (+) Transcript_11291:77-385(+)
MTVVLLVAVLRGHGGPELRQLLSMPWGVVSLVDLYVGFALFSLWIWLREESLLARVAWTAAMLTLGFWAGSLYVLLAALQSRGSALALMLGRRAQQRLEARW